MSWRRILPIVVTIILVVTLPEILDAAHPISEGNPMAPSTPAPVPIVSSRGTVAPPLTLPPLVNYSETTIPLPGFNPLRGFVDDNNCPEGNCSQVPVLDGSYLYYINNSSDLVRVPTTGGAPVFVSTIVPLYQGFSSYAGMIQNAFFIEDGMAYLFGTASPSNISSTADLTVESVNLTVGGNPSLLDTNISISPLNQGVFMTSPTELVVVSTVPYDYRGNVSANMVAVNMTTGAETRLAILPFFEANNLYWVPQIRGFFDVEADGSALDIVEQWSENSDGTFSMISSVGFDSGVLINWVNGIGYNTTSSEIAFSAGGRSLGGASIANTYVLKLTSGILTNRSEIRYRDLDQYLSGQQYVYTGDWVMGVFHDNTQYLFDPWTGETKRTNEPFTDLGSVTVCNGGCYLGQEASGIETLIDFHASLALGDPFFWVVVASEV